LELYVIVAKSDALADGVYRYSTKEHSLTKVKDGGPEALLGPIAGMQAWIPKCPAVFVIAGTPSRFRGNDPARKETNTYWESGAAAQALLLAVTASGLGATPANGVNLEAIHTAIGLPSEEKVTLIVPVGNIVR
jgi:SagB-type dehydrogenase family enzyme